MAFGPNSFGAIDFGCNNSNVVQLAFVELIEKKETGKGSLPDYTIVEL